MGRVMYLRKKKPVFPGKWKEPNELVNKGLFYQGSNISIYRFLPIATHFETMIEFVCSQWNTMESNPQL